MKVGIALNMLTQEGRPDAAVLGDHLALGDLAEPLGFDSLFALEHHFTGYAMSPAPTQLLSYYAGRTKRITFGTAVIVLPWHDPVRVAEQIALWTSCAADAACSASAAARPASNTRGSASRWARPGRALSRRPISSSRRWPTTASSTRANSSTSRARRSGRGRSRIRSAGSTLRR